MPRFFALGLVIFSVGCRSNPGQTAWLTGSQRDAEALAGARAAAALESGAGGIYHSPEGEDRLQRVGLAVAPHGSRDSAGSWQFVLLGSDKPNAFALPPQRIYITRGLYERIGPDDALLAAALAHEMAHIHLRDCFKPECRSAAESLDREKTADRLAGEYLSRSGFPSDTLPSLLRLIADVQPKGWADARVRYIRSAQ